MPNVGYRSSALTDSKLGAKSPSAPGADASSASPQRPSAFSASCLGHHHGDQPRRERAAELTAGSGPRPHPHLPFCSCSADIILFQDLAFTLKSHHCHQGRNVIIFALKMWFLRPFSFLRCFFLSKPLCICVHTVREKASDTKWELVMWELLGLSGNMVRMW